MLNDTSRQGICEILASLDDNTLFNLAGTVTQGLLKNRINTRDEAVNAILNYSPDALSFLRRKIITREVLFAYLHAKNVSIDLPATKNDLVQKTAQIWSIQYVQEANNQADSGSISLLAEQFTRWFYAQLNKNECLNHEHFYPNVRLKIVMSNNGQVSTEVIENDPLKVVQGLYALRTNFNLFFNPNLSSEGVQGRVDPHGLVLVLVCGTLHTGATCVGVFEQVFALARDPQTDNNWKIKSSEINLKSESGVRGLPVLANSNLLALT
ncbi:Uncharacterized protein C3orf38-like protein [Tribolium castaneum]|uniref:Uncharacterized protein C3orf38-like protein n=1 Tax=Tribolium castaneum TaxID=7070 RepID=A0A139WDJ0_TRICA|nr:PREDICTED: uncharacterized protein C3orf38 homolog [Tribolium castaneum]KYB26003.1 Uncharacterized protein C3orf38-like protein [Tribolium castaneum]|eukprot:XP_971646.1 PREDICTED: uncharacterized protein C3orf38 homolog [Tribolium castaneum]